MDKNEGIKIEYISKRARPAFGGIRIEAEYSMTHTKYDRTNIYRITCSIDGIESLSPEVHPESAEFTGDMERDSNDETLTEEAALQLFEDQI